MREQWTILYDRDCGFCRWSLARVLAWDREERLRPIALQDPEAMQLVHGIAEDERMASWHLVSPGGHVRSAGAAIAPLMRELPGGRPIGWLAERFPGATQRGYRWIAGHRTLFGRRVSDRMRARADARIREREGGGGRSAAAPGANDY